MLASIAILGILMIIVFSIYNQASKAWLLGEKRTETFQNARLVLDMMGRELETALASSNTLTGQKITFLSFPDAATLPAAPAGNEVVATRPNDQLFFVGTGPDSAGQSYHDLTEYGYFVAYAQSDHQTMRSNYFYLVRHMARSNVSGFDIFSAPGTWPNTPVFSTSTKTPILDNVLRLWVMFETPDTNNATYGTSICRGWTNAVISDALGCSYSQPSAYGVANPEVTLPRAVHIRLALLERRAAARLASYIIAKGWTGTTAGSLNGDLGEVIPNCNNQDLTTISSSSVAGANPDAVLQSMLLDSTHYFSKTVYLRNSP